MARVAGQAGDGLAQSVVARPAKSTQRVLPHRYVAGTAPAFTLKQAHHHRSAFVRQLAADERSIAPAQGPRPNSALDVVVVNRNIAVQQESSEPLPVISPDTKKKSWSVARTHVLPMEDPALAARLIRQAMRALPG